VVTVGALLLLSRVRMKSSPSVHSSSLEELGSSLEELGSSLEDLGSSLEELATVELSIGSQLFA
jgi:hypothetical protein